MYEAYTIVYVGPGAWYAFKYPLEFLELVLHRILYSGNFHNRKADKTMLLVQEHRERSMGKDKKQIQAD